MPEQSDFKSNVKRIAYFISPHGFGHAARSVAVMQAISDFDASVGFEIFTTVPSWFFQDSMSASCTCHALLTDIGLVQKTAFHADLNKTLRSLDDFLPFPASLISEITAKVKKLNCILIICDISPLGISIAKEAGIPSVLVENFTWDWIYESYLSENGRLKGPIAYLRDLFNRADYHIQTKPVCNPCDAHLTTAPVSRKPKTPAPVVREQLGIPQGAKVVLVTMGGIQEKIPYLERLIEMDHVHFIMPGSNGSLERRVNLVLLPQHSAFFHPDLVNASDAVIGKVGYSTLAEVYHAGIPFGYISRHAFRESSSLVSYIEEQMQGIPVEEDAFFKGQWSSVLPILLQFPRIARNRINGADQAACFLFDLLRRSQAF